MKPALLLVDLQHDYLTASVLEPCAATLVSRVATLLEGCRERGIPVFHVLTTIDPERDDRMTHWKRSDRMACVAGTPGHAVPPSLAPRPDEPIVHKTHFSAFQTSELDRHLERAGVDTLLVAGIHLHGCIRATVLDAYQRNLEIWVIDDAVGSDDPLHAAITRRYLAARAARLVPIATCFEHLDPSSAPARDDAIPMLPMLRSGHHERPSPDDPDRAPLLHRSPRNVREPRWRVPMANAAEVADAAERAAAAGHRWSETSRDERARALRSLARVLEDARPTLVEQLVLDVGKPITEAEAEVTRSVELLQVVADTVDEGSEAWQVRGNGAYRRRGHGLVGLIAPWNNPLAIPIGKLAPALLHGNAMLWKPALPGSAIAMKLARLAADSGIAPGAVTVVCGDRATAEHVMLDDRVDAVTLSGSSAAGHTAQEICARRRVPLQAELGGNNAAVVWDDAELRDAAEQIAAGAFGFAGQRCTANRRVVVDTTCYDPLVAGALIGATRALVWGDPMSPDTQVGPLISVAKREEVAALVQRAPRSGKILFVHPSATGLEDAGLDPTPYHPPTIVACDDPTEEIVQEETFGPVLVVQRATDWDHALDLANGVRQGLVAALFSGSKNRQADFLKRAKAGILKLNQATHGAGVDLPFGGWKASGVGAPEHGPANREFHTRFQSVYSKEGWE